MRVMIAPDSFGETLTSAQACAAIAAGWARVRPADEAVPVPQSDGGPGFVDVLAASGGRVQQARVSGPLDDETTAQWLLDGDTAYLESAQACGLGLLGRVPDDDTALRAHSRGVGQLVRAALDAGAHRIVLGLGGSSCTDGGRGLVEALGGWDAALRALDGVDLVAATDVENTLLGPHGAAYVFGPQKGAGARTVRVLEDANAEWAARLDGWGHAVADAPGAGAAGGIGAALLALGAQRASGARVVADRSGQDEQLAAADLLVTGEGRLDRQSLRGKAVIALASAARAASVPTVCVAGQVELTTAELSEAGIEAAYSLVEHAGTLERALSDAENQLMSLAASVAGTRPEP